MDRINKSANSRIPVFEETHEIISWANTLIKDLLPFIEKDEDFACERTESERVFCP